MISIPFSGNKRYSYKRVKEIVEDGGYTKVFEPFGGSAVLSVNLYNDGIVKEAYINDYDGLFDLYPEYLDIKDWIVEKCYDHGLLRCVHGHDKFNLRDRDNNIVKFTDRRPLNKEHRKYLQSLVATVDKKYWPLLATGLNFTYGSVSSRTDFSLKEFSYFASYLKTDKQREYLSVVNKIPRDKLDYKDFLIKHESNIDENSILILDPPYTKTNQKQYKEQFDFVKTQEIINKVKDLKCDFIFFNHNKAKVMDWLENEGITDYTIEYTGSANNSANKQRRDVMAYVKRS